MPKVILCSLAAGAFCLLTLFSSTANASYRAEIRRTQFGIPHIKANDYAGLGYGLGYAYAQDNFCLLADRLVTIAGERSKFFGPDATVTVFLNKARNLESDFFFKSRIDSVALRRAAANLPGESKEMMRGYEAGYNRYLRDTGVDRLPVACRGMPWVRPMNDDDQLRLVEDKLIMMDFESPPFYRAVLDASPPDAAHSTLTPTAATHSTISSIPAIDAVNASSVGSNAWGFGRAVTSNGSGVLLGNPHFPWETVNRFYEAHLTIPHRLDVMGATLPGPNGVVIGFNRDVAWTHTISSDRHYTLFELALDPADPTIYIVDGVKHPMVRRTIRVDVLRNGHLETEKRDFYSTSYGPIVAEPKLGLAWTLEHAYAMRDANQGNLPTELVTHMRLDHARSVADIRAALSDTRVPYLNTIATDRRGDVLYADITPTPDVTPAKLQACAASPGATALAQTARIFVLDGSKSNCNWELMPPKTMPQMIRPDYVANSNDSFWLANPASPITSAPPIVGLTGVPQNLRTRAGVIEIERRLAGTDGLPGHQIGPDEVQAMIYRNRNFAADLFLDDIVAICGSGGGAASLVAGSLSIQPACSILANWNRRMDIDSRGAYLFQEIWSQVVAIKDVYSVPFNPADPLHTPSGLSKAPDKVAAIRQAIAKAVATLTESGLPLDAPLGQVQFFVAGDEHIPLGGGSSQDGILNALKCGLVKGVGYEPIDGSSYIEIVTFDKHGPIARGVLTYSQSTDPASSHFADQTRVYSAKEMPRLPFEEREIRQDRALTTTTIAE